MSSDIREGLDSSLFDYFKFVYDVWKYEQYNQLDSVEK